MTHTEITLALLGALAKGDFDGAVDFVADDFVCVQADSMPFAGVFRGKPGFLELMGKLFSTFNDFELVDSTEDGQIVILLVTVINRSDKGTFQMPLTELWRFRDGLLLEAIPCYFDPPMVQRFVAGDLPQVVYQAFHRKMEHGGGDRDRNIAIPKGILEKAATGDWNSVNEQLDARFHVVESDATPYGGIYDGETAFPDIMRAITSTWKDFSFSVDQVVADDRRVFIIQTVRGKISDRDVSALVIEMWEIEDSKIVRVVPFYFDPTKFAGETTDTRQKVTAHNAPGN